MANIRDTILGRYKIDIAGENILKLYKLESEDISPAELEEKLKKARTGWSAGANSPNEKVAARYRERLSHAGAYEEILRNDRYRRELFSYYGRGGKKPDASSGKDPEAVAFADEYFKLVATTKKIKKDDVDFFFDYYQSENKNKKAIYELLKKQYKVRGLGKGEEDADDDGGEEPRSGYGNKNRLIVTLFKDSTLILIRKCFDRFSEAAGNAGKDAFMYSKFPALSDGLYGLCGLESARSVDDFQAVIESGRKLSFGLKQEKGESYTPLVNLFNNLYKLSRLDDVTDNFEEFKLLIKYPDLSPYMYAFAEMKKSTLDGLFAIAGSRYAFADITDFILNYYLHVRDNFGISDSGIKSIIKKAENHARSNAFLGKVDKILGQGGDGRHLPPAAFLIHLLLYWPIFVSYLVFETAKAVFTRIKKIAAVLSIVLFVFLNWFFGTRSDVVLHTGINLPTLLDLRKIIFKSEWYGLLGLSEQAGPQEALAASIVAVLTLFFVYLLPPLLFYLAASLFSGEFNSKKNFDWDGIERTWRAVFSKLRESTARLYAGNKAGFFKKSLPGIIANIAITIMLLAVIHFAPLGLEKLSEFTGYGQKTTIEETVPETTAAPDTEPETNPWVPDTIPMVITVDAANIRSGPGTDYEVISKGYMGNVYEATGNTGGTGQSTWYEIYLDDTHEETGWASETVIGFK